MDEVIRTPDQRVRVFVSSTLEELGPERAAARSAITGLHLIPVMFELGARPHPPRDVYRSYLDQSHVFVGIYWQSYGWVAPGASVSGIEDELSLAGGRPRLVYVKEPAPDRDPALAAMLEGLRAEAGVSYHRFATADELAERLGDDLAVLLSERFEATGQHGSAATFTFLFADLERSTPLLEALGEGYTDVLGRYQRIVSEATLARGGTVEGRPGDGMFCVFEDAAAAVAAAVAIDQAVAHTDWPPDTEVRVRIGIHTGRAVERAEGYVGLDVHRAARVGDAANGGQILVSEATAHLVASEAAVRGWEVRDLGPHDLRGLSRPERIFQVDVDGLPTRHPPLRARRAASGSIPTAITPLVGRTGERRSVVDLLRRPDVRLVTLTGPGGTGKTRLAMAVAEDLSTSFPDGVGWVALAPVTDPTQVPAVIGQALGLFDAGRQPILETVAEFLSDKAFLLVVDNFEQVTAAAPVIADLLERAPGLTVLATSRSPLRVHAEHEWPLTGLAHPVEAGDDGLTYPAVELFVERARAANPRLALDDEQVEAIAAITRRLDGLPLAIELAAARVRHLDPRALAGRGGSLLDLLAHGARDLPARQQTMRDTIRWSEELLDETTRRVFAWLSVFVDATTLEAVDGVLVDHVLRGSALDQIERLADVGLVTLDAGDRGEPRISMLRVVREYAAEALETRDEVAVAHRSHADWFLGLVEQSAPHMWTPLRDCWIGTIDRHLAELRGAFTRLVAAGDAEGWWRLAAALGTYLSLRGPYGESVRLLEEAGLSATSPIPDTVAPAMAGATFRTAGILRFMTGDFLGAAAHLRRAVAVLDDAGEVLEAARARAFLGLAGISAGDPSAMVELATARSVGEAVGDLPAHAIAAAFMAEISLAMGDVDGAAALLDEAESAARSAGDRWVLGIVLIGRSNLAIVTDDMDTAVPTVTECLGLLSAEMPTGALWPMVGIAYCHLRLGEVDVAQKYFEQAMTEGRRAGDRTIVLSALTGLAGVAAHAGDVERGGRLLGAADAIREATGYQLWSGTSRMRSLVEGLLATAGDPDVLDAGLAAGRQLRYDEAVALATP